MSAIRSRRAADPTRSRGFLPRVHYEARLEGTPTQSLNMKSAGSAKPRPQYHYPDPHDCRGHHGGFSSTLTGRGVSTSPCAVGTSPTAVSGTTSGRQWSSSTSSGGAQRLGILRRYPYPVYGTAAKLPETTVHSLYPQHCTHGFVLGCSYMRNGCPQWATMSFQ